MLDVKPFPVTQHVPDGEGDLYVGEDSDSYTKGAVAEETAHVTLMFGLMENANEWKKQIDMVLDGWRIRSVEVDEVGFFDNGEDFYTIIAQIRPTDELLEGNARLKLLPHIETFPDYKPHLTLAYVKHDDSVRDKWVKALGAQFNGKTFRILPEINYGDKNAAEVRADRFKAHNALTAADAGQLGIQQASLQQSVEQVEEQVALAVLNKVTKNAYDASTDVLSAEDQEKYERELFNVILVFLSVVVPLQARAAAQQRSQQFGRPGTFTMDAAARKVVDDAASKAATSHVATIVEDLRATVKQTMVAEGDISRIAEAVARKYPDVTALELRTSIRAAAAGGKSDSEIASALRSQYKDASFEELLKGVRQSALAGAEHDSLVKAIRQEYSQITKVRASVIAKTETNRAFTMSQYEADRQFLDQNGLTEQAYKKWVCRGPNPCVYCLAKQAEPPIPFGQPFAKIGDVVEARSTAGDGTVKVHKFKITYETVQAGDIHPNGNCGYELEVR
jgi:2'-5' RNA ligase